MAASLSDMNFLSQDAGFTGRVRAAMIVMATNVAFENPDTVPYHRERVTYSVGILNAPDNFKALFASGLSTDTNIIADATQAGTVVLTSGNVATQAALVTDAHITSAVTGQYNNFFRRPGF